MSDSVLVVGAAGFIGRHLCKALVESGRHVIAATRRPASFDTQGIENVVARFDARQHFEPLVHRCKAVVHAAASTTPGSTAAQPQLEGNLRSTLALLEALQDSTATRLVYLSSGGTLYGDRSDSLARESDPLQPRSYHGAGKVASEVFVQSWARQFSACAVVLRPSNVFGPGQIARSGFGVVPTAFERALDRRPFVLWGDGETVRDYLFIDDFIDLCTRVVDASFDAGVHVFNASSGEGVTVNRLLDCIDAVTGRPMTRSRAPSRSVDVAHIVLDNLAARSAFRWQPATALEDGLRRTWQWYSCRS